MSDPQELLKESKIQVPKQYQEEPMLGCLLTRRYREGYKIGVEQSKFEHLQPISKPYTTPSEGILPTSFETTEPFQKELATKIADFYNKATLHKTEPQKGGLALYGDPGTGKTMCCDHIIGKLESEGLRAYKTSVHTEILESKEFQERPETHAMDSNRKFEYFKNIQNERIQSIKQSWKDIDIFYIDDTNNSVSDHGILTTEMIRYAKEHNKLILMNANKSPYENGFLQPDPLSHVDVLDVRGQDYRQTHSWYKEVEGSRLPAPQIETTLTYSPAQTTMSKWIHHLKTTPQAEGILFSGPPGIGKSTIINKMLSDQEEGNVMTLTSKNKAAFDSIDTLSSTDVKYLIIEDINNLSFDHHCHKLLSSLCNSDILFNRHGTTIKCILISNIISTPKDMIKELTKACRNKGLDQRMISRFSARFKCVPLTGDDLRTKVDNARITHQDISPLLLDQTTFYKQMTDLFDKKLWDMQEAKREEIRQQFMTSSTISIKFMETITESFHFKSLIEEALDLMEDEGKHITFITARVTDNPEDTLRSLEKLFKDDPKYLSRLKRFTIST